jgi:hypothetical protein
LSSQDRKIRHDCDSPAIDIIGYTICYQRMGKWMKDKGYPAGIQAFDTMGIQFVQRIHEEALADGA